MRSLFPLMLILLTGCISSGEKYECLNENRVCGADGITYRACDATERGIQIINISPCEECKPVTCELECPYGFAKDSEGCEVCDCYIPPCNDCQTNYEPVCGINNKTYQNHCFAYCEQIEIFHDGECGCLPLICDLACEFGFKKDANGCEICECEPYPGCSSNSDCVDGEYCAFTRCNNALSDNCNLTGECLPNNCNCTAIYEPVCGEDGKTYFNSCLAECNETAVTHTGSCITCEPGVCDGCETNSDAVVYADNGCLECRCP